MTKTLVSGSEWLGKLQGALTKIVTFMALRRYGQVPDVDDRVSDALVALVEGANRFNPQPGRDGVGYFLQYTLSYVAGALRNGASNAKGWSDEAVTFSDVAPTALGIDHVWETLPGTEDEEPDETLFVLNNGKVAGTLEIVELITGHEDRRRIAAKHLGIQADDRTLPVQLLRVLDGIAEGLTADGRWLIEEPSPEPVVTHELDLPDVVVMDDGIAVTYTAREAVEMASRGTVPWLPEQCGVQYETDDPWPSWMAGDEDRAYRSPYQNDNIWPKQVDRALWLETLGAWAWSSPYVVLAALAGEDIALDLPEKEVMELMDTLAVALLDEADGSCRRVAGALAFRVKGQHAAADKQELYESFCEFFGVDGTVAWTPEQPSVQGLEAGATQWVEKVAARRDVWPSQAAAVTALVLKGASPREAKRASQSAYHHSRRPTAAYAEASA